MWYVINGEFYINLKKIIAFAIQIDIIIIHIANGSFTFGYKSKSSSIKINNEVEFNNFKNALLEIIKA